MKFGGTSMAGTERIRRVAQLVKRQAERGDQVAVVVSAMSGETDRLVNFCREANALYDPAEYLPTLSCRSWRPLSIPLLFDQFCPYVQEIRLDYALVFYACPSAVSAKYVDIYLAVPRHVAQNPTRRVLKTRYPPDYSPVHYDPKWYSNDLSLHRQYSNTGNPGFTRSHFT